MADLVAADVSLTINDQDIAGKKKRNQVKIVFGDGAKTYPANGVPMPAMGDFGMVRNITSLIIHDAGSGNGLIYKYDLANHKIRIYEQGMRTGSTNTADATSGALAEGGDDGLSETAVRLMGTAKDVTYQLGALKELLPGSGNSAPIAVVLQCTIEGW